MAGADENGEKTEEPTQRKLDEARKRGDVVKSQEVNSFFVLVAATVAIGAAAPSSVQELARHLAGFLGNAAALPVDGGLLAVISNLGATIVVLVLLPLLAIGAASVAGNLAQHRPALSLEALKPKASKVSPGAGLKRLLSIESLINLGKGLVKLALVGTAMVLVMAPEFGRLAGLTALDPVQLLPVVRDRAVELMTAVVAVVGLVAAGDYVWQRQKWMKRQRMTLQEVKDEHKQSEGDPTIKQRIRDLRRRRGRQRMMSRVGEASVVIANPTHFAVALKYSGGMRAPLCLAKGVDDVALRIRKIAEEKGVPVIENPPLARLLHKELEIDQEIPEAHYRAVAEVIGYVMRRRRAGWRASPTVTADR
ncbi:MAG: flagellar biosynthesis protein FlhB [Bauldia sp.]